MSGLGFSSFGIPSGFLNALLKLMDLQWFL